GASRRLPRLDRRTHRPRPRALPGMTDTVVLCGSLGSTSAMWDAQAPALEGAGFRAVRTDHPGHNGRPLVDVNDLRDLARDALGQVDADRFHFVGLSLGGAIGMQLAPDHP